MLMPKNKLSNRQIAVRTVFLLTAIALVAWFFPHNESFRYEYEVGKPWRYGRLTAPYDFAIFRSDSAVSQMQDSLLRLIVPKYELDASVAKDVTRQLLPNHSGDSHLSAEATSHLRRTLTRLYAKGIVTGQEYDHLQQNHCQQVFIQLGDTGHYCPIAELLTERQAYELLRNDSLYGTTYAELPLQRSLRPNLSADTTAMRLEYARMRQQVSATSGIVLAESRIIDQGEIVTPRIYDILESYRREQQQRMRLTGDETIMTVARLGLIALILGSILFFLSLYRPWIYMNQIEVFIAIGAIVVMFILTSLANRMAVGAVYLVPIGIVTVLLSTFHGSRTAYYCHIIMVLLCSFIAPSHYEYLIIQCMVGMIIVFSLKDGLKERSQLLHVSVLSAIGYTGIYALYTLATEGSLENISWPIITMMVLNAILLLLSYLIIYVMENAFGLMSDVTLSELCNLSRGTLLRLSQEATGTFMHSYQVANLAASAAGIVKANTALVRTGAYYHDIGKLWNPGMYTENQEGLNPHDKLTTEESVDIIKRHVTEGVRMAQQEKLPRDIISFIQTHHGQSRVKYFFIKWCNAHPDEQPDLRIFSYPGPDPTTKEQAILMLADSVEAATRSLPQYTDEAIAQRVNTVVQDIVSSGRLNYAKISLYEIQQCCESFIHDLKATYHARVEYPQLNK